MRDYLVFQLYGHLASWGDIAVGETRPSAPTPAKSAVLGIIAAALGLCRPNTARHEPERQAWETAHARLAEGYGMAVKVEILGTPLSDYHTAQVPSSGKGRNRLTFGTRRDELTWMLKQDLNTILSRREYHQDAFCTVALWVRSGAPHPLNDIYHALLEPRFTLYLGRKACPLALPLAAEVRAAEWIEDALAGIGLETAFARLAEAADDRRIANIPTRLRDSRTLFLWDGDAETRLQSEQTVTRRDTPLSRERWQFSVRSEHRAYLSQGEPQ